MLTYVDLDNLREFGYVVCTGLDNTISTLEFAESIGEALNLHTIDNAYPNRPVDMLRPQEQCASKLNSYHGNYGFSNYPAHTDLAHWLIPPRFLLLRGRSALGNVSTYVYSSRLIAEMLPSAQIKRALFYPRNARVTTALRMNIEPTEEFSIRWDSLFIRPANSSAISCVEALLSPCFESKKEAVILDGNSMLIIDNWKTLHGRSSVPISDRPRKVERVYMENIYGI